MHHSKAGVVPELRNLDEPIRTLDIANHYSELQGVIPRSCCFESTLSHPAVGKFKILILTKRVLVGSNLPIK